MATTKEERRRDAEENESDGSVDQDAIAKEAYEREREKQANERMNIETQEALGLPIDADEKKAHEEFFAADEKERAKEEKERIARKKVVVVEDTVDVEDVLAALGAGDLRPNSIAAFKIDKDNRALRGGNLTRLVTALSDGGKIIVSNKVKGEVGNAIEKQLGKGRTDGDYVIYRRKKD